MSEKMLTPEFNLKIKSHDDGGGDQRGIEQWTVNLFNNHWNNRSSGSDLLKKTRKVKAVWCRDMMKVWVTTNKLKQLKTTGFDETSQSM